MRKLVLLLIFVALASCSVSPRKPQIAVVSTRLDLARLFSGDVDSVSMYGKNEIAVGARNRVALLTPRGDHRVFEVPGGSVARLVSSRDQILAMTPSAVWKIDTVSGDVERIFKPATREPRGWNGEISGDGRWLFRFSVEALEVHDLETKRRHAEFQHSGGLGAKVAVYENRAAFTDGKKIRIVDFAKKNEVCLGRLHSDNVTDIAYSADGLGVYVAAVDGLISRFDSSSCAMLSQADVGRNRTLLLVLQDGRLVATTDNQAVIAVFSPTLAARTNLQGSWSRQSALASDSGQLILASPVEVLILDLGRKEAQE